LFLEIFPPRRREGHEGFFKDNRFFTTKRKKDHEGFSDRTDRLFYHEGQEGFSNLSTKRRKGDEDFAELKDLRGIE
jgi:hypothetical protein